MKRALTTVLVISLAAFFLSCSEPLTTREKGAGIGTLTGAGLGAKSEGRRNFELGICTEDFETIDRIRALFEAVWSGVECMTCKLRSVCPDPIGGTEPRSLVRLGRARRLRRVY